MAIEVPQYGNESDVDLQLSDQCFLLSILGF